MRTLRFKQVDVFTGVPLLGNPLAVVFDADDLTDAEMQRFAAWTNLSETTFITKSKVADYRVRIFTPRRELPFAGHPTIGSAHAVREAGRLGEGARTAVQECGAGLISISFARDGSVHARAPRPKRATFTVDAEAVRASLHGLAIEEPIAIDVGPVWITARVATLALLDGASIASDAMTRYANEVGSIGVTLYALDGDRAPAVHVRSFAPGQGIAEDPVCGSGNVAVAAHIRDTGLVARVGASYVAHQGKHVGRDGRVAMTIEGDDVQLGGASITIVDGAVTLSG